MAEKMEEIIKAMMYYKIEILVLREIKKDSDRIDKIKTIYILLKLKGKNLKEIYDQQKI